MLFVTYSIRPARPRSAPRLPSPNGDSPRRPVPLRREWSELAESLGAHFDRIPEDRGRVVVTLRLEYVRVPVRARAFPAPHGNFSPRPRSGPRRNAASLASRLLPVPPEVRHVRNRPGSAGRFG